MPRKNDRKTVPRAEETKKALANLIQHKSNTDGLPKTAKGFISLLPSWFEDSGFHLRYWLAELNKPNDSTLCSMLLQIWLHLNGISLPKGVFKRELNSHRGRPLSDLGFRALVMRRPGFGWRRVTKLLVPDRYAADKAKAVKYIKDLATSAKNAPDHDSALEDALKLGSFLLGIKRSKQEAEKEYYWEILASEVQKELGEN
jgi:hypothetical protein